MLWDVRFLRCEPYAKQRKIGCYSEENSQFHRYIELKKLITNFSESKTKTQSLALSKCFTHSTRTNIKPKTGSISVQSPITSNNSYKIYRKEVA